MRLLTSVLRRRWRQSPPRSFHFASFNDPHNPSSSSPSYSLFSTSIIHTNHHQSNYINPCSSEPRRNSTHNFLQVSRQFSTKIPTLESNEPMFPIKAVISLLDSYHDVSGLPWWFIISSFTVAMRLALFPLNVLQLKKLRRIGELLPKLPPPFPPPLSGRSFRDQLALFFKEKKTAGCPSVLWFVSSFVVQVPCFFLALMSIRRMSLNNHSGFDSGGTLWFENLTEYPHGVLGPILPLIIASLHFTNVKISFKKTSLRDLQGTLGSLIKIYRVYLQLLTIPILIGAFNVPQGSLVYWVTNSSMSLIQLLCLRNPNFLKFLGVPEMTATVVAATKPERESSAVSDIFIRTKEGRISAQILSPAELVSVSDALYTPAESLKVMKALLIKYSIKVLTDGHEDTAIRFLRIALEKDPGNVRALLIMGQILLKNKQFAEAVESLEKAISKLHEANYPTEIEKVDHLILSSLWAGIANAKQGKMEEGLQHLERIAQLEEPEDSKSKAHYYDGLFVLSSALLNVNRKAEALKYLQKAAAYNPDYSVHLEQLETEQEDFSSDLANSRREF